MTNDLKTQLAAQLGIAKENPYGTRATVSRFYEFRSEGLTNEIERIESQAIHRNRRIMRSQDWVPGKRVVGGDLDFELHTAGDALLWELALGRVDTTGPSSGIYTHIITPGALPSFTTQVGKVSTDGTVNPFDYVGCMVDSWELSCGVDEIATFKIGVVAQDEQTGNPLGIPTYPTDTELLTFVGGSVGIGAATPTLVEVSSISVAGANNLIADRYAIGRTTTREPLEIPREVTGTFEMEFEDLGLYNDFYKSGEEFDLQLVFAGVTNTNHSITVDLNVRLDGDTPTVDGVEQGTFTGNFKAVSDDVTDGSAITVTVANADQTA